MSETANYTRRDLIAEWKNHSVSIGKYTAMNVGTCKRIIAELDAAGMQEAADWGRWMVWHAEVAIQREKRLSDELLKALNEAEA